MTATQIARRSNSLYADGSCGVTRRVLCDMVAQREADIESLKAKNTKLQEQGERLFDKTLELGTENAKLRELVRTFYHCTTSGECDECSINGGGLVHLMPDTICDTIHDRMRELGVEVNE